MFMLSISVVAVHANAVSGQLGSVKVVGRVRREAPADVVLDPYLSTTVLGSLARSPPSSASRKSSDKRPALTSGERSAATTVFSRPEDGVQQQQPPVHGHHRPQYFSYPPFDGQGA